MALKRPTYDVYLDGSDEPIRVVVEHRDSLGAERVAGRYGIPVMPTEAPQAHSTLYVWRALTRMGVEVGDYPEFANTRLDGFQTPPADATVGEDGTQTVDPTQPGRATD